MNTSAEQIHNGKINTETQKGKDERLFVDLDVCSNGQCKDCIVECSYYYHQQTPENNGIVSVAELAIYYLVCRRCEEPHCVNSCPVDALEQQKDPEASGPRRTSKDESLIRGKNKLLIRHNMRCISCKSCSHACPYGTIYPENVPLLIHNCDFCLDRRNQKNEPLCIKSCPYGALSLKKADMQLDENTFLAGDNLIVHSTHWRWEKA